MALHRPGATGCGYHTAGSAVELPQNIHTIAIPGFVSQSQTFRIEQLLTDAVVREFNMPARSTM